MIFLEIPFFRHYVFPVVQTSSSPTHPGGNPPLIWYARASEVKTGGRTVDMVDGIPMPPPHPEHHNRDGCATFKPHAIPSVKAATLQISEN